MKHHSLDARLLEVVEQCASKIPRTFEEKIAPEHTAILVIDVQNDFCHSNGVQAERGLDTVQAQEMVPRLLRFLSEVRKYRTLIIFIRTARTEWSISPVSIERSMKFPKHLRLLCVEGTWGAEFYEVSPQDEDCIVTKYRYSAFQGTNLEFILRSRGISTLILTGVATPVCVESTVREGYMKDFFIILVKDCVAARSAEENKASLSIMEKSFATLTSSEEIISVWKNRTCI